MLTRCFLIALVTLFSSPLPSVQVYSAWPFSSKDAAKRQNETAKQLGVPKHLKLDLGKGTQLEVVLIPAGKFMMGSPDSETTNVPPAPVAHRANESPLHEVTISHPFYMSKFLITQEQYKQIVGSDPSMFRDKNNPAPVDTVTWDEAVGFCQKASAATKRSIHLPTEAQWEYAARAGTNTRYSFGNDEKQLPDYSWFHDNAHGMTHPVGQKLPNAWGLFDVHGLLWEYTSDYYADSYASAKDVDPEGPASGTTHATRGGTWGSKAPFLRSAIRIASPAPNADEDILSRFGFRVAVDISTTK